MQMLGEGDVLPTDNPHLTDSRKTETNETPPDPPSLISPHPHMFISSQSPLSLEFCL